MNVFAIIILSTILVAALVKTLATTLNLHALSPELPGGLRDVYDAGEYARSQQYTRARARFGFVVTGFDLILLLLFWFTGGFNALDGMVRSWQAGSIAGGVLYIGILATAVSLLNLPFTMYSTFVIEERFGFNKTTVKTFIPDALKSATLAACIGAPLLAALLAFFTHAGSLAWLYSWAAITAFMIAMQYIAPTWIMPLFNKFTPLPDGELKEEILRYTDSVNFPLKGVFVIDGSRRSTKSNAYFTGFGKNKRIALFDTLIEQHSTGELTSILAHEIGHYRGRHLIKGLFLSIVETGFMLFLLSLFVDSRDLAEAFYMQHVSVYAGLLFFSLLYSPVTFLLGIALNMLSRRHEFEADRYAVRTCRQPEDMVSSLKKLSASNLGNLTPHPLHVFLNYSHPPLAQRIDAIRAASQENIPHRKKLKFRLKDLF